MLDVLRRSDAEQQAFFEGVLARAIEAEQRRGAVSHVLDVAGTYVRLVFAGDRLAEAFLPALAHLTAPADQAPGVTFHIWDSESTGVEMLPAPCDNRHFTDRGDIWGFSSERFRVAFHWIENSVNLIDRGTGTAVYWVRTARDLPYWTKASPLRTLFHWWMEMNGRQLLHAAAVGNRNGAILITGKGGVGKSTTALAALARGMTYVADDYLVVGLEPEPMAYSLYGTAKLNPEQVARFPCFAPLVSHMGIASDEKAVMQLHPGLAAQMARALPLRAIATPRITGEPTTAFRPTSRDALHKAAAFTTMSQLPYAGRYTHDFIGRLTECLPGFELALGTDLDDVVRSIERQLASPATMTNAAAEAAPAKAGGVAPLVTVVVPIFNGAAFLADAIGNILDQHYPSIEIIVVDDGSTDDVDAMVTALPVDVRFFKQDNSGAASARNRAIRDASGEFIAFLDVDDLWPKDNLDVLVEFLGRRPDVDVVHGYGQLMERNAETGEYDYVGNPGESFPFYVGAALYRRTAFERIGLFDTSLRFAEDTDWFQRASEAGLYLERLPQVTLLVRRHEQNMTRGKTLVELNTLRVIKKALDRKRQKKRENAISS